MVIEGLSMNMKLKLLSLLKIINPKLGYIRQILIKSFMLKLDNLMKLMFNLLNMKIELTCLASKLKD